VRFLDYNDVGGGGHNSDAIASLLAVAERDHVSGLDFLVALVASYELGARFGEAATPTPTSTVTHTSLEEKGWTKDIRGGMSQPPAIGRLMGMSEAQIANAIGICLSHTIPLGILDAHTEEHVMAKNMRFGWVAHDAILACLLARRGFTGPVRIVESDVGIRNVVARGELDLARLVDFSGWRIRDVRFKSLAANASTHGHVMATLALVRDHDLRPEQVAAVRIRAPLRESRHTTAPPKQYPRNAESADHSAFFANAIAIRDRAFGPQAVEPSNFTDPVVLGLIERITIEPDPALGYYGGASEITTIDGQVYQHTVEVAHGFGTDPLSDEELTTKFADLAMTQMPKPQVDELIEACWGIDSMSEASELARLMVLPSA
jgi:2-methylcitrate dehydratase